MCGIVGYLGNDKSIPIVIEGLTLLQNRGYDSVGISSIIEKENKLRTIKYASTNTYNSIEILKERIKEQIQESNLSIGHTRWATHGAKTDINAHPHHDNMNRIALVHNGIIENFSSLKEDLIKKGYHFVSQTDTEVIAVLIGYYLDNGLSMTESVKHAVSELKGTWALVIIHREHSNKLWITRNGSPLLLGIEEDFVMIASEQIAFHNYIKQYIVLNNHDLIEVSLIDQKISYNVNIQEYQTKVKQHTNIELSPTGYDHWTIKEIHEQPESVLRAINNGGRLLSDSTVRLGGLDSNKSNLLSIDHMILLGCGTSFHSGLWVLDIFKGLEIFDTVSIYDGADFNKHDIPRWGKVGAILISQSGETKDLHRCIQIIQENNMISIGVVNVIDSFIARESDCGVYLNAGREVAVASTKSFTNQCIVLTLIAIWFSQNIVSWSSNPKKKNICLEKRKRIIKDLHNLPFQMKEILKIENLDKIKHISRTIIGKNSMFILGKGKEEAVAKEGALKIKEITYIHAEGYSSSALKHGPFGLIVPGLPIILLDVNEKYREKNENVFQEVSARGAHVLKISDENGQLIIGKNQTFGGILSNVYIQLISYYCALEKGLNPDFPRNLAKVVTVE
jgi:glucosamine--fructose-6-phosphate aminotransferase (isomerizing)